MTSCDYPTENSEAEILQEGSIKNIIYDRGFGFIKNDKGDYYFHSTKLLDDIDFKDLKIGALVRFEVETWPNPKNSDDSTGRAVRVQSI